MSDGFEINASLQDAMRHLLEVSASLDSMVLGEREIITQVRKAFEDARSYGTGGDLLRLTSRKVIETAKRIFTETAIATRPVSVVSLAYKWFQSRKHGKDTPILLIGAGQTNANFARFLSKAGYTNVTVANRTLERAVSVASASGWQAVQLYHIPNDQKYRVVVSCTGSEQPIVTRDFLDGITAGHIDLIDMALPADVAPDVTRMNEVTYLGMPQLQREAAENIEVRKQEIDRCRLILDESLDEFRAMVRQREIELAMREIPEAIRAIRETAMGEVFAKELDQMDAQTRELLYKIVGYMEKKYISVPMKLARKVILENARIN
jgi:glutamyl-tRNA reductase